MTTPRRPHTHKACLISPNKAHRTSRYDPNRALDNTVADIQRFALGPHDVTCAAVYSASQKRHTRHADHPTRLGGSVTLVNSLCTEHTVASDRHVAPTNRCLSCGQIHINASDGIAHRQGSRRLSPGATPSACEQTYLHRDPLGVPFTPGHVTESSTTKHQFRARSSRQQTEALARYPSNPCMFNVVDITACLREALEDPRVRTVPSSDTLHHLPHAQALEKYARATKSSRRGHRGVISMPETEQTMTSVEPSSRPLPHYRPTHIMCFRLPPDPQLTKRRTCLAADSRKR